MHQDVNADNLLVDASADGFVTGILDFGDVVRSSVVGDLAVAMSYAVGRAAPSNAMPPKSGMRRTTSRAASRRSGR